MTHRPHTELIAPRLAFSRRRILQCLGATVALASLAGCGGDSEDEGAAEDEGTNGEAPEENEAEDEDD